MDKYCSGCPLDGEGRKLGTKGNPKGDILFVTDRPTEHQSRQNQRLPKSSTSIFNMAMTDAGVDLSRAVFHPSVRCYYDKTRFSTAEKRQIQKQCRAYLLDRIQQMKPKCVVPMGSDSAKAVAGRAVKITKKRGIAEHCHISCTVNEKEYDHEFTNFPILTPANIGVDPSQAPTFDADANSLARLQSHDYDPSFMTEETDGNANYHLVHDLQFLIDQMDQIEDLTFDLETVGTRSYAENASICTMQFCFKEGEGYLLPWDHPDDPRTRAEKRKLKKQLKQILCNPDINIIGQNLKFDQHWILRRLGFRFRAADDTIMLAACIDENSPKDMDDLVKRFVPAMAGYADEFNRKYDKSRMDLVPLTEILQYGVGDVDANLRLFNVLYPMVERDEMLFRHYRYVSMPSVNMFLMPDYYGMNIDEDKLDELHYEVERIVLQQQDRLLEQVPRSILAKHFDKGLKFSRADFVRDILFYHEDGFQLTPRVFTKSTQNLDPERRVPSTSGKDHLPYFFDECTFTYELAQFYKNNRLLGTNIKRFRENYVTDGKVYPIYFMHITTTGRSSCCRHDVPIVTRRGSIPVSDVEVGDYVFTHKHRWMPVTKLFRKPEETMYRVTFSNGDVLVVTRNHRLLTEDNKWVTLGELLDRSNYYAEHIEDTHERPFTYQKGSYGLQTEPSYTGRRSGEAQRKHCHSEGHDFRIHDPRTVQYAEEVTVCGEQDWGEESPIRELQSYGLRGWEGIPDSSSRREETVCQQNSDGGESGYTRRELAERYDSTSYRREPEEQPNRQPSVSVEGSTYEDTRTLRDDSGRRYIKEVKREGVYRVYDFEVAEDHSYLACGVFNHNSKDPNGQNIPKRGEFAKPYRACFVADPGWVILEADYSQAELRIAADMANEQTMIDIYRNNGDIHRSTATVVMGVNEEQFSLLDPGEQKLARFKAKAVNFGFLYGMWWKSFVGYAKTQYGAEFTDAEAEETRRGFFRKYSGLEAWHSDVETYVKKHKQVRSYTGRIRHLPFVESNEDYKVQEAVRLAINAPVQECASSLGTVAMARVEQEIDHRFMRPCGFVHDALYFQVREEYMEWGAKMIKHYMETNPIEEMFGRRMKLPMVADVGFGWNMNAYEMETLRLDAPYDWTVHDKYDDDGNLVTDISSRIPEQQTPPNDGRADVPEHLIYLLP